MSDLKSVKFSIRDDDYIKWLDSYQVGISYLGLDDLLKYYMKENTPVIMKDHFRPVFPDTSEMTWRYDPVNRVTHYHQIIK